MLMEKQITIIRCKNLVSDNWHSHFSPVSPHLLEKHSPSQNGQLWRYWHVSQAHAQEVVSAWNTATVQLFHFAGINPLFLTKMI